MRKIVYYLGNPTLSQDNLPLKIIPVLKRKLPSYDFIHLDPTEEFNPKDENLVIIDTVIGIKEVICFNDLNHWSVSPRVTAHDFDLPVSLGLLQKLGKLKKITIIGIPPEGVKKKVLEEILKYMSKLMDT